MPQDRSSSGTAGRSANAYWPEIDGLRAVAILLVVCFHAGVETFSGGFIGVDVFFVLSGFLITGILLREIEQTGSINLLDFYARRVRRLLPALTLVLTTTLLVGAFLLSPVGEQQQLASSAAAASVFAANLFFWRTQTGYFAGPAEEMPLLHLWTLAVEEQFYIAWPLVMMGVAALAQGRVADRQKAIVAVLLAGTTLSFVACWWLTPSRGTLTFYTMPFRAWEFGVGALLPLCVSRASRSAMYSGQPWIHSLLATSGVCMILVAALGFDRNTLFPGAAAALPVCGTAAAILGLSGQPGSLLASILKSRPLVGIGKLSYSWYLWHWPILAIAHASSPDHKSVARNMLLVLVALGLSALTYRYLEEPVRRQPPRLLRTEGSTVTTGAVMMLVTAALAAGLWLRADYAVNHEPPLQAAQLARSETFKMEAECANFRLPFHGLAPPELCTIGTEKTPANDAAPLVVLWGDSHAHHYLPGLALWAERAGVRLLPRTMGACKPHVESIPVGLPLPYENGARACVAFNTAVREELLQLKKQGATTVILAARWSIPSELQNGLGEWDSQLRQRIDDIRKMGLKVVVLADTPKPAQSVPTCVARRGSENCSRLKSEVEIELAAAQTVLRGLSQLPAGLAIYDPVSQLCQEKLCPAVLDGVVVYSDNSHLSVRASQSLAPALGKVLDPIIGGLTK